MSLQVHLPKFEGPLALLLHLIREQEMNIFDIDIAKITQTYLEYIKVMKSFDLELAGDFVAMAATLLQIKSRMLLPQYNDEGEVIENEDPRKELVQKLIEYQKYQEAAKLLLERDWVGRDVWLRGDRVDLKAPIDDDVELEDNPLFSLISAYRVVVRSMKSGVHKVAGVMQSIAARILEMKDKLKMGERVVFQELITADGPQKSLQVLVTFLSLLELAKMGFVSLFQSENFADIHVDLKRPIDGNVVSQVENYENVQSEQVANQILAESIAPTTSETEEEFAVAATDEEIMAEEALISTAADGSPFDIEGLNHE